MSTISQKKTFSSPLRLQEKPAPPIDRRKLAFDAMIDTFLNATTQKVEKKAQQAEKEEVHHPLIELEENAEEMQHGEKIEKVELSPKAPPLFYYQPFYPNATKFMALENMRRGPQPQPLVRPIPLSPMREALSLSRSMQPFHRIQPHQTMRPPVALPTIPEQNPVNLNKDSESLELSQSKNESYVGSSAYMRRNVYKSIIRHMFSYIRKNREEIISILRSNGFDMKQIEHAFFKISYFNDLERERGNPKRSQATLRKILSKKRIYTYILRETLFAMINSWKKGKIGKISASNLEVYKEVCNGFYAESVNVLGHPAQGTSFLL